MRPGFESGRCLSRPALVSRPNPTLGRRGWVNYLWVSFLLKASVPTHRIDRDHPATADSPRGNRPSPAASTSTGGDLFSPLVKTDPHHRRGSFFVPGGDPLPSEQMLTEILLGPTRSPAFASRLDAFQPRQRWHSACHAWQPGGSNGSIVQNFVRDLVPTRNRDTALLIDCQRVIGARHSKRWCKSRFSRLHGKR